jgi:non-homologous end joining protein Ku
MPKALAPQPNRSTTSITLSWGMINIPCSVYTGTESVSVTRKEFVKDTDHNVGRVCIDKETGVVIDRADIVRKAEATNGVWVELDDDEIAAVTTDRGLATVEAFVPNAKVGEYLTEGLSQVRPRRVKGKVDPGGNRSLALLFAVMKREKVHALINVALRGPARYALLDANGDLRLVVTADCIRQPIDMPDCPVTEAELVMAAQFVKAMGKSAPLLVDSTARQIQAYVDSKAEGRPVLVAETPAPSGADLVQQLMASIDAQRPAAAS